MIYQNDKNENTQNQFSNALKELQIGKLESMKLFL